MIVVSAAVTELAVLLLASSTGKLNDVILCWVSFVNDIVYSIQYCPLSIIVE